MRSVTVFHPDNGFGMCYALHVTPAPAGITHPEHGEYVSCGLCGRLGVIPEPGHELEFLPPGTEITGDGRFLLRYRN